MLSIAGGKATTLRAMAEITANRACAKLGVRLPCSTADQPLPSARRYYQPQPKSRPAQTKSGTAPGGRP